MNCVKLLCLLAVVAKSCVAFAPPDSYPTMGLEILSGEDEATALKYLDETLVKLSETTDGAADFKVVNILAVLGQVVSAKKLSYQLELTQNNFTKLCAAIIWREEWLSSGNTEFQLYCENETFAIDSIF